MRTLTKAVFGTATILGMGATAQAQSLFEDMALEDELISAATSFEGQIRSRQVMVDRKMAGDLFRETALSRSLNVKLMSGVSINLDRTDLDMDFGEGSRSWSGRVRGFEDGFATFVSDRSGRLNGHVQYGGQTFRITPGYAGVHTITEMAPLDVHQEEGEDFIEIPAVKAPEGQFSTQAWPPVIDIMVMYTDEAVAEAIAAGTTAKDEAMLAVSMAKTAMVNTGLRTYRFRWRGYRGMGGCGYADPSSTTTLLFNVSPGRADTDACISDHAVAKRDQVGADMVAVVKGSGGCGTAWYSFNGVGSDRTFSVTARPCIGQHTFTHELGHNLGLKHDRVAQNEIGTNQTLFNYGLTFPERATPVRTIMAYNGNCSDQGVFCTRVPVFSNSSPNGMWNGERMGRGLHLTDPALNRKQLMNNWSTIASYR